MATIVEDPPPNYTRDQQIFCINFASNAAGKKKGTTVGLEAGFKRVLDRVLPTLTPEGSWKTVWGPAVYKLPKDQDNDQTGPLNAWFVAQSTKDKLLVVAIAGTAQHSTRAWLEDCNVRKTVNFDDWTSKWTPTTVPYPTGAAVKTGSLASFGTCFFVYNVLSYASPKTGAAKGTLLGKFLQDFQKQNPDHTIIFTGHSLGGAVSPSLALGLVQSKIITGGSVYTMPTAGASPGNAAFNDRFVASFPRKGSYNVMAYNTLDIVPQAWSIVETQDRWIGNINKLYRKASPTMRKIIAAFVEIARRQSEQGTQYIGLPGEAFTSPVPIPSGIKTWKMLRQAGSEQHVLAYVKQIGIVKFYELVNHSLDMMPGIEPEDTFFEEEEEPSLADLAAGAGMTEAQLAAEVEKVDRT